MEVSQSGESGDTRSLQGSILGIIQGLFLEMLKFLPIELGLPS